MRPSTLILIIVKIGQAERGFLRISAFTAFCFYVEAL